MKNLTTETANVVSNLRSAKVSEDTLHGRTPLTYVLGEAISRLSLLDVTLQRKTVYLLWLHDTVLGVFNRVEDAKAAAGTYMSEPEYAGDEWKQTSKMYLRWYCKKVSRLEIEERPVR